MNKNILYILTIVMLTCCSCKSKKQVLDKPDDLISRSTLTEIIAESYIIESTVHLSADSLNKHDLTQQYYKELFDRYHITLKQFTTSIDYYVADESSADKLLADASKIIEKKKKKHMEEHPGDTIKRRPPSIENAIFE